MSFTAENHGLASECELQTGGTVHRYASVDELEKVRRAYVFLRRNDANVIGKAGKISLDQPLHFGCRNCSSYCVQHPVVEGSVGHRRVIGHAVPVDVSEHCPHRFVAWSVSGPELAH